MLHYTDSDFLKPVFSTLVIKVSSIVKHFESLENFITTYDFDGETNGVLLIKVEMCMPAFQLEAFADEALIPNGLKLNEDFVFIDELLANTINGVIYGPVNEEHTHCKNINWLQGMIVRNGNYIWYSDPNLTVFEKDANFRLFMNLCLHEKEKFILNPRIIKIDDEHIHYTVSGLETYYKLHRDALWYNEKLYGKSKFT